MVDFESSVVYFRCPSSSCQITEKRRRQLRYSPTCSECGAFIQVSCNVCGTEYVEYDTLYECGQCGTPKKLYCTKCKHPLTLDCIYFDRDECADS